MRRWLVVTAAWAVAIGCDSSGTIYTAPGVCGPAPTPAAVPFRDVTAESGIDFVHHTFDGYCDVRDAFGPGVCLLDYDGDGDLDAYFADRAPYPHRLYANDGSGHFTEVPGAAGAAEAGDGMGCLAFDADGDGDPDLLATNLGGDHFFRNDGGTFVDVTVESGLGASTGWSSSATAGDMDGDGDLDLFVGRFLDPATCPPPCNLEIEKCQPEVSVLYENRGGTFVDVTAERGLGLAVPTLAARWQDFDGDGDLDLYVGNDLGAYYPDQVYVNDGTGHFVDRAHELGLDQNGQGNSGDTMGVDVADWNADQSLDLIASNDRAAPLFFQCDLTPHCAEDAISMGLGPATSFNWSVDFVDFDDDQYVDLFVTNGSIFSPGNLPSQLFWNVGSGFSVYRPKETGDPLGVACSARSTVFADLNGDHGVDVLSTTVDGGVRVLRNQAARGHWLDVALPSTWVGARVRVTAEGRTQTRWATVSSSFMGSVPTVLHFGTGDACTVDVDVRPIGGQVTSMPGVAVDQVLSISGSG